MGAPGTVSTAPPLDISLLHGWFSPAFEALAVFALVVALGRRSDDGRHWFWIPMAVSVGGAVCAGAWFWLDTQGWMPETAPVTFWFFAGALAAGLLLAVVGWRSARWWRRTLTVVALPLVAIGVALAADQWSGYYTSVDRAWDGLTAGPLPHQTSPAKLVAFQGTNTPTGVIVPIAVPANRSHFRHRTEYVYLPPAWFHTPRPTALPAVIMIGGVVTTPEDWVRSGNAAATADRYASAHGGVAPIMVLIDPTGSLTNDTECVDGPRGNVDTHVVDEVRPYVISHFGASPFARHWGVVGWSMGGTCAVDLAVRHPDMFGAFADISGDLVPNAGDHAGSVRALFGGNSAALDRFDPTTVMVRHGNYDGRLNGWFQSEGRWADSPRGGSTPQIRAAHSLSTTAARVGIRTVFRGTPGGHSWAYGANAFVDVLPWLMSALR
ncbi:S-formylglutathione hydrolase FrmB [Williamsia sterculiae]|uniref:S-formylglutathione hydrolase FrmB n=1 Tax=Williamsia sterculiae TaxID=1344003 RepID=A0A1N7FV85_9NOCA|nr:S-formylglutathione hydrolase FrmB [Williamsia sterculiae]